MAEFPSIAPAQYQQDPNSVNRIGKKDIVPGSIQDRHLSADFITVDKTWMWNFSLLASQVANLVFTFDTPNKDIILPVVEMTVCQDVYDAAHNIRSGGSINVLNWDIYGPTFDRMNSNGKGAYVYTYVLNKDTVTHTVIAQIRLRYISVQSTGTAALS